MDKTTVIDILTDIEDNVYIEFGISSRPYGDKYILAVVMMAEKIIKAVSLDDITKEVREELTEYNYHMVNHAIDLLLITDRYSGRTYKNESVLGGINK